MILRVIGLMSGTSLDGVDAAYLETDGVDRIVFGPALTMPYPPAFRSRLRGVLGGAAAAAVAAVERELTDYHLAAVTRLRDEGGLDEIDLIGFHGHTILHQPDQGRTWQIGDGGHLATQSGIPVICDFRSGDVAAGGQGAPFVPAYHRALAGKLPRPLAILNIGGVANVTWIGAGADDILSFDTGPGNAPIDDWILRYTGAAMDRDGAAARAGTVDRDFVNRFRADPYFAAPVPKSLDRDHFRAWVPAHLNLQDGAATLTECVAVSIALAAARFPAPAETWLVTGGGRHNPVLMKAIEFALGLPVRPVESVGWDGDALEAQAFAYLAVRSLKGLPLSFPGTTGVPHPLSGGRRHLPLDQDDFRSTRPEI